MAEEELKQRTETSPGSDERDRKLGLTALDTIQVQVPGFELQC